MQQRAIQIEIDPVKMNITNRIDKGSRAVGPVEMNSGFWLGGVFEGDLTVRNGPLVVQEGAILSSGKIVVEGDVYLFGQLGKAEEGDRPTTLECTGELHFCETSLSYGKMRTQHPMVYSGAKIQGKLETF